MRNWDPLSVFKYLSGGMLLHATMFVMLIIQEKVVNIDEIPNEVIYEKRDLVWLTKWSHFVNIMLYALFETGFFESKILRRDEDKMSETLPVYSLLIQITVYQTLVFRQLEFFFYTFLPVILQIYETNLAAGNN